MSTKTISIATDFSRFPAGRFRTDGDASGQAFREDHLVPALHAIRSSGDTGEVEVIFDDVAGFGSSFLEEAFGGLVRVHQLKIDWLRNHLSLKTDEPELEDFVFLAMRYLEKAGEIK